MIRFWKPVIALLSVLFMSSTVLTPVPAIASPVDSVGINAPTTYDDSSGVSFTVSVPWEKLDIELVEIDGRMYSRVSIPGWASTTQVGAPELPAAVEQIGVPFGSSVEIQATPGESHTVKLEAPVIPVATQVIGTDLQIGADGSPLLPEARFAYYEDQGIYSAADVYPSSLAILGNDGTVRQQRVLGIISYPVQYNPQTNELTVYESLEIEVTFLGSSFLSRQSATPESEVYEGLFGASLLNYDTSAQWRQSDAEISIKSVTPVEGEVWAPPSPGWRVKVRTDGFYRLTYTELASAGLPVDTLDPATLKLYNLGNEIALYVDLGGDTTFNSGDYLLFYGQGVTSKYTADNIYWLTYGGAAGLRMTSKDGTPVVVDVPANYPAHIHMEQNSIYFSRTPGDEYLERWFWDYLYPPSRPSWTRTFTLAAPSADPATLTISMLGFLDNAINPDHHVTLTLNGTPIGDTTWDGITWNTYTADIPAGLLVAGTNTLVVTDPNDTGVGSDVVYIDWVELDYANTFVAESNALEFNFDTAGTWAYAIDGFTTNDILIFDISNLETPVQVTGGVVSSSGSNYKIDYQDTVATSSRYWTGTSAALRTVSGIETDTSSNLASTANGADYIVITHSTFASQAETLRAYRAGQGLRTTRVDVQDIYDEFGYGIVGAAPIRDFLAYTYASWTSPAPSYVVLIGDGHYDPKNFLGLGRTSYIPPYLAPVDPWIVETSADNLFVTISGADTMPDMMLGRLPVNSTAEATAFVNKIIAYEAAPSASWQQQVLAVADNADGGGNFPVISDGVLTAYLPAAYTANKVYYGIAPHTTISAARTAILAAMNSGQFLVNYVGHASQPQWATEGLFKASDVPGLTNSGKLAIMLPMTCYDGYFHFPYQYAAGVESVGEVVTRADNKGAVASWSPSGLGVSTGHDYLDRGFFEAYFQDGVTTVGQAVMAGKLTLWGTSSNLDLLDTYHLFGDPAERFPFNPTSVELLSFTGTAELNANKLNWETATESDNLGFNLYRSTSLDGEKIKLNSTLIPTNVPPGSIFGASYAYTDTYDLKNRVTYFYWLEDVDIYGLKEVQGPVEVEAQVETFILNHFTAAPARKSIVLQWQTASEPENTGFNLYRSTSLTGNKIKLNKKLIPSLVPSGSLQGASYTFMDSNKLKTKTTYYYWLEDVDVYGETTLHGPVETQLQPEPFKLVMFATTGARKSIVLVWAAVAESEVKGYNLYRATSKDGVRTMVNSKLIPVSSRRSDVVPSAYKYTDTGGTLLPSLAAGKQYFYWLEVVDNQGKSVYFGPIVGKVKEK